MNCREAQRQQLLAGSGELGTRAEKRLESHMQACAVCRAFRDETERLIRTAVALPLPGPGPAALAAVSAHARTKTGSGFRVGIRRETMFGPIQAHARVVWALAASLLVLFGWFALRNGNARQDMNRIHALWALVEDVAEPNGFVSDSSDREEALRRLGLHLLRAQGMLGFDDDLEV